MADLFLPSCSFDSHLVSRFSPPRVEFRLSWAPLFFSATQASIPRTMAFVLIFTRRQFVAPSSSSSSTLTEFLCHFPTISVRPSNLMFYDRCAFTLTISSSCAGLGQPPLSSPPLFSFVRDPHCSFASPQTSELSSIATPSSDNLL